MDLSTAPFGCIHSVIEKADNYHSFKAEASTKPIQFAGTRFCAKPLVCIDLQHRKRKY